MYRFIVIGIVLIVAWFLIKKFLFSGTSGGRRDNKRIGGEELVEDPGCHTYVPVSQAYRVVEDGKTLYFCSKGCYKKYRDTIGRRTE